MTERSREESPYARSLIEASLDPLVTISADGKITDVNRATELVTGVARDRLIGTDFADYFTQPDEARAGYKEVFAKGSVKDYPLAIRHTSGRVTDVLYNASVYRDGQGNVLGVFAAARDITERKRAEEKEKSASTYSRSLIEASLDPLVTISADGKVTDVNRATELVTGVARDKLIGTDFADYFTEPEKARAGYKEVFAKGSVTDYPLAIRHSSGRTSDVLYNASVYRDVAGHVQGVFAAARDVTALRRASQYARSLIEASLDPLVTISPDGKVTDVNQATEVATGVARGRIIGTDFADYFTEPEKARAGYKEVFAKGSVTDYALAIRHRSGRVTHVLYNASVYKDDKGAVLGVFAAARDVTAQRQASQYARSLIEASLDPLVTISVDGKITDVNSATEVATGVPRERLIGTDFADYFTAPDRARAGYKEVFAKGSVRDYALEIRHNTGHVMPVLYNASVYKDDKGAVLGVFAAARDVTAQRRASQYARSLIEASLDPLVTISAAGKITDVNQATESATGVPRERLIGKDFADYFTEPEKARAGYKEVFAKGSVTDYPLAIRHTSGAVRHVLYNASVYKDDKGTVLGVFAAARDVTAQRQASQYARSLIEASLDPLVTISPDGKVTDVNQATESATGVPRERLIGTDFADYFTEPDKARAGYKEVFAKGSVTDYPLALRHSSGRVTDVLYNASVYRDIGGQVQGVFAAARDVTALRQASQYARSLIEASLDPLVTISADGKITDVNQATEVVTGVPRERLIGTDFADFFTEPEKARAGYKEVFARGSVRDYPLAIRHNTGRVTDVLYNASVYRDDKGNVLGVFAAARDITERKHAEEKQRSASQYARSLIEASLDPLVTISPDGKITDVNRATELATGVPRELLIGTDFADYFTEPEKAREGYQTAFSQATVKDYPLAIRHGASSVIEVLYNASVYKNEAGEVLGVFAAARDVTERKRAEALQRAASSYSRSLIEASLDPLVTISPDGKIRDVNRAAETATGLSRDQLVGADFADFFTDPQKAREGYKEVFAKGSVTDYPLAIRHTGGRVTDVLFNASVYRDATGKVQGVFAAARDVTERKKAEEIQLQLASIVQSSEDAIIGKSLAGVILSWNPGAEALFGYSAAEIVGQPITVLIPKNRLYEEQLIMDKAARGERVLPYETERVRKDGVAVPVSLTVSPVKDSQGKIVGLSKIARDITERKKAEEVQRGAAAYVRSLIEASLDPLVTISPDGKVTDVNQATEAVTGVPRERLIGTDFADYFTEPEKAREGYKETFAKGSVTDYPLVIRHSSGRSTDVLYNASVYRDINGKVQGVFAAARDVTKLKEAERVLAQRAEELARSNMELETFSYSVSHDLRAPMRAIEGISQALVEDYGDRLDATGKDYLERLIGSAQRMDRLIQDILDYSRLGQRRVEVETVDVAALARDVLQTLEGEIRERRGDVSVVEPIPPARADRTLLSRLLANYVSNATKFVGKGVPPVVRIEGRAIGDIVRISVVDNGIGIDPAHQQKIWGVFERLHGAETYPGTGIGLAIVRRAAERMGGKVGVDSKLGTGSRFWVDLPAAGGNPP